MHARETISVYRRHYLHHKRILLRTYDTFAFLLLAKPVAVFIFVRVRNTMHQPCTRQEQNETSKSRNDLSLLLARHTTDKVSAFFRLFPRESLSIDSNQLHNNNFHKKIYLFFHYVNRAWSLNAAWLAHLERAKDPIATWIFTKWNNRFGTIAHLFYYCWIFSWGRAFRQRNIVTNRQENTIFLIRKQIHNKLVNCLQTIAQHNMENICKQGKLIYK